MEDIIRFSYCPQRDQVLLCGKEKNKSYQFYLLDLNSGIRKQLTHQVNGSFLGFLNNSGDKFYLFVDKAGNESGHWEELDIKTNQTRNISRGLSDFCSYEFALGEINDDLAYCWFTRDDDSGIIRYENLISDSVKAVEIYKSNKEEISFPIVSTDGQIMAFYSENNERIALKLWNNRISKVDEISQFDTARELELLFISENNFLFYLLGAELYKYDIFTNRTVLISKLQSNVQYLGNFNKKVLFSADVKGNNEILEVDLETNKVGKINLGELGNNYYQIFFRSSRNSLLFLGSTINKATDLYEISSTGEISSKNLNSEPETDFSTKEINFLNKDTKLQIQGWLFYDKAQKRPLIINLHGGPHACAGKGYSKITSWFLKEGFDYFELNYSGSSSFGEEFKRSIYGDPGEKECLDIYHANQYFVRNCGYQQEQIYLQGDSYGGFLALLFAGKFPGVFSKIISVVGIGDLEKCYEEFSDQLKAMFNRLFEGSPKERPMAYKKSNPITYLPKVKDQILIINGLNDIRCPTEQMKKYLAKANKLQKSVEVIWFKGGHMDLLSSNSHMENYLLNTKRFLDN